MRKKIFVPCMICEQDFIKFANPHESGRLAKRGDDGNWRISPKKSTEYVCGNNDCKRKWKNIMRFIHSRQSHVNFMERKRKKREQEENGE